MKDVTALVDTTYSAQVAGHSTGQLATYTPSAKRDEILRIIKMLCCSDFAVDRTKFEREGETEDSISASFHTSP